MENSGLAAFECWGGVSVFDDPRESVQQRVDLLVCLFDMLGNVNFIDVDLALLGLKNLLKTLIANLSQLIGNHCPHTKACVILTLCTQLQQSEVIIRFSPDFVIGCLV